VITDAPTRPTRTSAGTSPSHRLLVSALLALPVVTLSVLPEWQFRHWQWIALTLAAPIVVWGGWPFHRAALQHGRRGRATTDTLVSLGTLAAFGWSVYALLAGTAGETALLRPFRVILIGGAGADATLLEVAAGVTVLALAGRYLEAACRHRAGAALRGPVLPGGALVELVTRPGETTADHGADLGRGADLDPDTDPGTTAFAPLVMGLSVATLGYWLGADAGPAHAVIATVAVLLVAGPCAVGLATPTALLAGIGRGTQLGILINGPEVLGSSRAVDTVVLGRTGTLTTGVITVHAVHPAEGVDADQALRLAGAVEQACEHPVARAITAAAVAAAGADELPGVAEFDSTPGVGVRGVIAELEGDTVIAHAVLVGRPALLAELDIELPADLVDARATAEAAGHSAVTVAWDGVARAVIAVGDKVRPDSAAAVGGLRALGLTPILLTGDDGAAARVLAGQVGIDPEAVLAEVGPDDTVGVVRRLQGEGRVVAMIGDRVDDAAALAAADLGLALGPGAAAAGDHRTLLRGGLPAALDAIRLARRTLRVIRSNRWFAVAYHTAALPLAASGLLNPLLAGAAMASSSVFVLANSLRLRRFCASRPDPDVT
jgi:P-type Cu+ transporter